MRIACEVSSGSCRCRLGCNLPLLAHLNAASQMVRQSNGAHTELVLATRPADELAVLVKKRHAQVLMCSVILLLAWPQVPTQLKQTEVVDHPPPRC